MKYTSEITIDLPINRVIELFDSTENLYKWQPDLVNFEHLSGEPGTVGAKSKLSYKMGKREMEMIETITKRDLPDSFAGTYEMKNTVNTINNRFEVINSTKTRWIVDSEFTFTGIMAFMSIFMKGVFKKQTMKFLQQFKAFAEGGS